MSIRDLKAKKSLGQNFLVDEDAAARIIDAAEIAPDETVLEIGPGKGVLTRGLAKRAGKVIAIELDPRLVSLLKEGFDDADNVEIVHADALAYPYEDLKGRVKVVANLPYYISTPILGRFLKARSSISAMVLMLQKEVAERITAHPGGKEYGYLSVMVQLHTEAKTLFLVSRQSFKPVPKVDSTVVRLKVLESPLASCRDYGLFERVVSAAFSLRRKTLRNALKASGLFTDEGIASLAGSGIDPVRRAETMSVGEFARLADFLFEFRKSK